MNREIKFRVWDTERMFYPDDRTHVAIFSGPRRIKWGLYWNTGGRMAAGELQEVLMQYTGLKDSKGTEIYEGDVVRHVAAFFIPLDDGSKDMELVESEDVGSIIFDHGSFMFVTPEDPPRLSATLWPGVGGLLSEDERYDFEVIGNIYENPELLSNE